MNPKDTLFSQKLTIRCQGRIIDFSVPRVMGILNVTQDSFYEGSRFGDAGSLVSKASEMLSQGADLLDVGAFSSRPGALMIPEEEEKSRLKMALQAIRREHPDCCISVDTFRAGIAEYVISEFGVGMINDISAGQADIRMMQVVGAWHAAYVMMHMQGTPQTMQVKPQYGDVVKEILAFFAERKATAIQHGITDIVIDPGFGFGKTMTQNYQLLHELGLFRWLEVPVMVGISRKSMIYRSLDSTPEKALNGTSVLNTLALHNGAHILRVHDVAEAAEAVKLFSIYSRAGE
jgi:dihydropteroate synthase